MDAYGPQKESRPKTSSSAYSHRYESYHSRPRQGLSNLQSFFVHTAPCVPTYYHHHQVGVSDAFRCHQHFRLADLWDSMNEWSAYGVEVPLKVPGDVGEVVQCYVPYLSAIQIFDASKHRQPRPNSESYASDEDLDSVTSDCASECCSSSVLTDSDSEDCRRWLSSIKDHGNVVQQQRLLDDPARLLFQFFEHASPHMREPLTERIKQLSSGPNGFAGLQSLLSCDIHPASWMAVAWYPIYRIPASGRNIRDLNASFLTFHSLVCPQLSEKDLFSPNNCPVPPAFPPAAAAVYERRKEHLSGRGAEILNPFAFVPYKMHGITWNEDHRTNKLQLQMVAAAHNWVVERRNCAHPDLDFFLQNLHAPQSRHR